MPPVPNRHGVSSAKDRIPGLDGLRGCAVVLVVVYHLFPTFLPGGFVGVSLFFALSGFLITHRLVVEHRRTGRIDLVRFAVSRVRRLVPASTVAVVGVLVVWSAAGWLSTGVVDAARWSLLQVSNWGQLAAGVRYGTDTGQDPFAHFWSLSVEEQMFWVFPLMVAVSIRSRRQLFLTVGTLFVVSAAVAFLSRDTVVVYYSTVSRAAEFLAGSLVVLVIHAFKPRMSANVASGVAAVAVVALVFFAFTVDAGSGLVASGVMVGTGVVAAVAVAATSLSGRSRSAAAVFDTRVLRWFGSRSYGIYLYHWPVIVAVGRWELPVGPLVAVAATVVLAEVSYRVVEQPFLKTVGRPVRWAAAGSLVALAATIFVPHQARSGIDFEAAAASFEKLIVSQEQPAGSLPTQVHVGQLPGLPMSSTAVPPAPARREERTQPSPTTAAPAEDVLSGTPDPVDVFFVGDSKALTLALATKMAAVDQVRVAGGWTNLGCPAGRGGKVRYIAAEQGSAVANQCDWTTALPTAASAAVNSRTGVDVAVVYFGTWDTALRTVPAFGDRWMSVADSVYRDWLYGELVALNDVLLSAGVRHVVWLTLSVDPRADDPLRAAVYNDLIFKVAAGAERATVVDLAGWLARQRDSVALLPDNVHMTWEPDGGSGAVVLKRFLAAQLVAAARVDTEGL